MTFSSSSCSIDDKLYNFTKYVERQRLSNFLIKYEIFKKQLCIKGSVIECGIHQGGGLLTWAKISSILEPYNYHRKIIGFDTFEGYPKGNKDDKKKPAGLLKENFDVHSELLDVIKEYDKNRFLNNKEKIEIIKGDANKTIPQYIQDNKHLTVSLLFLDFDLYEPTVIALEHFLPRMPKGAILAFNEINNADWQGETQALLDKMNLNKHKLECLEFEPNISFVEISDSKIKLK